MAELLPDAAPDILTFTAFPVAHWQKLWSNLDFTHFKQRKRERLQLNGTG